MNTRIRNFLLTSPIPYLLIIILLSSGFIFWTGMTSLHDFLHGARIAEMHEQLLEGQLPPRWSPNFGYGYGMPLFQFYAPLPWMIGAIIYQFSGNMLFAVKSLFVLANVFATAGGYFLSKAFIKNRPLMFLGTALLVLLPYRALNLAVRGAVSEVWGVSFLICVLAAFLWIWKYNKGYWAFWASLVGLFLSHNLTTLMSLVPFAAVGFGFLVWRKLQKSTQVSTGQIFSVLYTGVLAVGTAAFYLIPSFLEKSLTQVDEITTGYFLYNVHFLYFRQFFQENWVYGGSGWGPDDTMSFFLGWPILSALSLGFLATAFLLTKGSLPKFKFRAVSKETFFAVSLALAGSFALLLATFKSEQIWQAIPAMAFIQFPWRWLGVASVSLGVVSVWILGKFTDRTATLATATVVLALSLTLHIFMIPIEPAAQTDLYRDDPLFTASYMSQVLPDYLPKSADQSLLFEMPPSWNLRCKSSECAITELFSQADSRLFSVASAKSTLVTAPIFDYPGWRVEIDGVLHEHTYNSAGLIEFLLPEGEHQVGIWYGSTQIRSIADAITLVSLIFCLYHFLFGWPDFFGRKRE